MERCSIHPTPIRVLSNLNRFDSRPVSAWSDAEINVLALIPFVSFTPSTVNPRQVLSKSIIIYSRSGFLSLVSSLSIVCVPLLENVMQRHFGRRLQKYSFEHPMTVRVIECQSAVWNRTVRSLIKSRGSILRKLRIRAALISPVHLLEKRMGVV